MNTVKNFDSIYSMHLVELNYLIVVPTDAPLVYTNTA
jgi:hypothetical protein